MNGVLGEGDFWGFGCKLLKQGWLLGSNYHLITIGCAAAWGALVLGEKQVESAREAGFGTPEGAKLLTAFEAATPLAGKEHSGAQAGDARIKRSIAGIVDEIGGLDGSEMVLAAQAD